MVNMSEVVEEEEVIEEEANTETLEETEQSNPLEMSDEDFEKQELPEDPVIEDKVVENKVVEEEIEEETKEEKEDGGEPTDTVDADTSDADTNNDIASDVDSNRELSEQKEQKKADKGDTKKQSEADLWKELIAPIKANGKTMVIDNVEDARRLMSMGMGFSKKMEALKPNLKFVKMLENNDLLDESKLSYLIDLSKKDSKAIQKLIKDSGIDPLDVDTEKESDYSPGNYSVNDKEVELDTVLDGIRDSSSYQETLGIISDKWDEKSKDTLFQSPEIIEVINEHVGNGIYAKIADVIDREKILGRLQGLSDLEAYKQVGDAIQAEGGFDSLVSNTQSSTTVKTKPKANGSSQSPKVKAQKKAVVAPKAVASKSTDFKNNPLNMSDDDFDNIAGLDF
jgi:hypothetical protein